MKYREGLVSGSVRGRQGKGMGTRAVHAPVALNKKEEKKTLYVIRDTQKKSAFGPPSLHILMTIHSCSYQLIKTTNKLNVYFF